MGRTGPGHAGSGPSPAAVCEACGATPEDEEEQRDVYRIGLCRDCLERDDEAG